MQQVGQDAHAAGEMLGNRRFADAHALSDFSAIQALDAAERDCLTAARRQAIDRSLQPAEFLGFFLGLRGKSKAFQ